VHCGYAAVAALHDVVASDESLVLRYLPGDPHPIPYIRVMLNVEYCRRMFGAGPWDELADAWQRTHPLDRAVSGTREFLDASIGLLPRLAELSLLRRMQAFGGKSISELISVEPVRPQTLLRWAQQLGPSLYSSPYWAIAQPLRLLALSGYRLATEPENANQITRDYEDWTLRLGGAVLAA
jgi:hypothetical protein